MKEEQAAFLCATGFLTIVLLQLSSETAGFISEEADSLPVFPGLVVWCLRHQQHQEQQLYIKWDKNFI